MTRENAINFVRRLDAAWMEGRFADLAPMFASNAVISFPDGSARVEGARAIVESYEDFMSRAVVRHYATSGLQAATAGDTAVVEYQWEMTWEADGMQHVARGREALVLVDGVAGVQILWRLQIPAG